MNRNCTQTGLKNNQPQGCCAFTLIELLVVIAIISLLVSILLPSLTKAKELAQKTVCTANLHNFQLAMAMYTEENDGYLPTSGGYETGQDPKTPYNYDNNWMSVLAPYLDENPNVYNCYYNTPEGSVWTCPGDDLTPRENGNLQQPSYGVNRFLTGWYTTGYGCQLESFRVEEIDVPMDKLPLMSDSDSPWGCTPNHIRDNYSGINYHPWPHRHQDGDAFLFVAGNQEWIPRLESEGASIDVTYALYVLSDYFTGYCTWWR
jgi:prepilin-type N-terminal cleavage/methylation domain-containing protein